MKLINAYIESFGCFEDRSFDFSEGFDLIVGDNESGKSTLLTFIKFMLYGMPRKTQENTAERERSISVKSGLASGRLKIRLDNGECYTLERRGMLRGEKRGTYSEDCRIIDERSGVQVHKGAVPGELFLGVPVSVFESTALVRQMRTADIDSDTVGDSLSNMLLSADEALDLQKALDRLDTMRKTLLHKSGKGGALAAMSDELDELSRRLEKAKSDSVQILGYTETVEELKKNALARRRELDRLDDTFTAFGSISVLKRFDLLHTHEKKLETLEVSLEELKNKNKIDGKLPDRDLSSAADENARSYRSALDASRIADERLEQADRARKSRKHRCPDFTAEDVRRMGGVDGICLGLNRLSERAASRKKLGMILTVSSLASVLLGAGAVALLPQMLIVGLLLCGGAAVLLTLGIVMISASKKLEAERRSEFEKFGRTESDTVEAIRAYLSLAFDDELSEIELEKQFSIALSTSELRGADLELASAEADRILEKWKVAKSEDRIDALILTAEKVRNYYAELDGIEREISIEKRTIASLSTELGAYGEADLRARVPAELMESYSESAMDELDRRRRFCSTSLRSITERQIEAERELVRLESESEDPARVSALLDETKRRYNEEKLRFDSCVAASEALSAAGANIRDSVTPVMRKMAGKYMSDFTDGKYDSLGIENGCVAVTAEGKNCRTKLDNLSAGTRDAAYFALRLSLLALLFKSELPPLILDEALAQLDDRRAGRVLEILQAFCREKGQCLLFTCHSREKTLTDGIATVNVINL